MRMNNKRGLINQWKRSGHLDGISGMTKDSVAKLYECKAAKLLREESKDDGE